MIKIIRYSVFFLMGLGIIGIVVCILFLQHSLPVIDGEIEFDSLTAPVTAHSGRHGIPVIKAENRVDAIRALGYVTARDRLFQMDLMRRKNGGSLAEIFGQPVIESDVRARTLGFNRVAKAIVGNLSPRHRQYLEAYAEGVNRFIAQADRLPFEFTVLAYRPRPWTSEDSILIALGMFDLLTGWAEKEERMLSVMDKTLPRDIVAFLSPDSDRFTDQLLNHEDDRRPAQPIPVESMSKMLAGVFRNPEPMQLADIVQLHDPVPGSNAWVVSAGKTSDGRAILASDMHLGISVPTIWYRAQVHYGSVQAAGVILPGLPVIIAGSNRRIAWGETNLSGDFLDLVSLDVNPDNPEEYRYQGQWRRFDYGIEKIKVKGAQTRDLKARRTVWGPVSNLSLLGRPVAVHWTALDDEAFTMGLIDMEEAETMEQALTVVQRTGGPQLNFLLADDKGRIAWTLMGKIPDRKGGDGSVSRSWADGNVGWNGYVNARDLPIQIDPPEGFLVSANHRRFSNEDAYVIGRQFANGYRAYRISRQLGQKQKVDEKSMFALQLDAQTEFYSFYKGLALSVLSPGALKKDPDLTELRDYLLAWQGKADVDSLGLPLLVEFRRQLTNSVFKPFLAPCVREDKDFSYSWTYIDTPLQAMLTRKVPQLLPDPIHYRNWDEFILGQLRQSARKLKESYPMAPLAQLTWGEVNRAQFNHPFSRWLPALGPLLDMPSDKLAGCAECIRVATPHFGASERLVVSPGHMQDGILHMPGGQSGHPLSPYYMSQHEYWVKGLAIPFLAEESQHKLVFKPHPR